jgi:hypothetical protein
MPLEELDHLRIKRKRTRVSNHLGRLENGPEAQGVLDMGGSPQPIPMEVVYLLLMHMEEGSLLRIPMVGSHRISEFQ